MPKVASLLSRAAETVDSLRASAVSVNAREALVEATAAIAELNHVDRRARDYIRAGEQLMAGDVVFAEGSGVAAAAAQQVEASRLAEHRAFDEREAALRRMGGFALGGAAAVSALVLALLASTPRSAVGAPPAVAAAAALKNTAADSRSGQPSISMTAAANSAPRETGPGPSLNAVALLCTDFGRVKDRGDLTALLARAATLMDASGLIAWIGSAAGGDLSPVLAHGYTEQTLARIPPVPRSADNAAAAAYRTGLLQIVTGRPGSSRGALVAPMLAPEGCIGSLTAEIRGGGETSEAVQALATIVAAQLAGVLSASVDVAAAGHSQNAAPAGRAVSA
jgi:hypothetical protein